MKKVTIIIIIVIIASAISGCLYRGNRYDLYQMTRVSALATNGVGETDRVAIEVIEEDAYGRTLFSYAMDVSSAYYGYASIRIVAICQKSDKKATYYYEDECFIISDTFDGISEEDIDNLKLINDWGKPINEDKLSSRPINPDYTKYRRLIVSDLFSKEKGIENGAKLFCRFTDYDGKGKILFYIVKYDENYDDDIAFTQKFYLMIINEDGSYDKDTFVVEIEDLYNYQKQLHEFKINNGWSFS